ncbi:RnfABCDGE type electron transport complex subunit G [Paludibacter sp.]
MAKLESTFKNMVLVLSSITLVAALALGSVYNLTKEPIEASKIAKQQNAIMEVLPPDVSIKETDTVLVDGMQDPLYVYKAYKDDEFIGAAVQTYSKNGFSGEIKIMVGFDKNGNIINYSVLEQKETPGLGTKMVDWFKTNKGKQNICGLNAKTNNLKVTKDGGEIDAITAATISSNAFLESVRIAYSAYSSNFDGLSGATETNNELSQTN